MSNKHFLFLMLCYLSEEYYVLNKKKLSNKVFFVPVDHKYSFPAVCQSAS